MCQATIAVPPSISEGEAKMFLAMKLFEVGRLSCGQAADLAGYSKRTFVELLGKHHVRGNQVQANELLGISRTTLRAKVQSFGFLGKGTQSSESEQS